MKKQFLIAAAMAICVLLTALASCKSCNKNDKPVVSVDSTTIKAPPAVDTRPMNSLNLPHADSSLIPVLAKILDDAFQASEQKDYIKLGGLIIYKGPDAKRFGYDVFNAKNGYEKAVVRITADVFNKWNKGVEARENGRVFDLDQPDGSKMEVLEVIFVSKKTLDRKFFGFIKVKEEYKIVDVTSYI